MQRFWESLGHISVLGRNHWSTHLRLSGELTALELLSKTIKPGGILFDVGANSGEYSLEALRILEPMKIYAFEPSKTAYQVLCNTIMSAGLERIITPERLALGEARGQAILHSSGAGATSASLLDLRTTFKSFSTEFDEPVIVTTLDEFCKEKGIKHIDLLKIDVEGLELAVLKGAIKMIDGLAIGAIQFEFGVGNIESRTFFRDFFDLLAPQFNLFRVVSDGLWPVPRYHAELEQCAAINYMAVRKQK